MTNNKRKKEKVCPKHNTVLMWGEPCIDCVMQPTPDNKPTSNKRYKNVQDKPTEKEGWEKRLKDEFMAEIARTRREGLECFGVCGEECGFPELQDQAEAIFDWFLSKFHQHDIEMLEEVQQIIADDDEVYTNEEIRHARNRMKASLMNQIKAIIEGGEK